MSWSTIALIIIVLLFILVAVFFAVVIGLAVLAYVFRKRWRAALQNIVLPDPRAIEEQFHEYGKAGQTADVDELVGLIINKHANKAGLIGTATGIGGVFLDVVGLPVDAVSVLRVQASMIFLIAYAHGYRHDLSDEDKLKLVLVLSGSNQVVRYVGRYLVKILLTSVPGVGAIAGYILNYFAVQGTGRVASRYFSGRLTVEELKNVSQIIFSRAKALTDRAASGSMNVASTVSGRVKELVHRPPSQAATPTLPELPPSEEASGQYDEASSDQEAPRSDGPRPTLP